LIHTQRTELVLPLLVGRWAVETEPEIRADILIAVGTLDNLLASELAIDVLGHTEEPQGRLCAATACIAAGMPWDGEVYAAGTAWLNMGRCSTSPVWWTP
jgi:hypothetical protein